MVSGILLAGVQNTAAGCSNLLPTRAGHRRRSTIGCAPRGYTCRL